MKFQSVEPEDTSVHDTEVNKEEISARGARLSGILRKIPRNPETIKFSSHQLSRNGLLNKPRKKRIFRCFRTKSFFKMGPDVSPPYPTQYYYDVFKINYEIFNVKYNMVVKNDNQISASNLKELDKFLNAMLLARDFIIISAPSEMRTMYKDVDLKMEKVALEKMKLEQNKSFSDFFDDTLSRVKLELAEIESSKNASSLLDSAKSATESSMSLKNPKEAVADLHLEEEAATKSQESDAFDIEKKEEPTDKETTTGLKEQEIQKNEEKLEGNLIIVSEGHDLFDVPAFKVASEALEFESDQERMHEKSPDEGIPPDISNQVHPRIKPDTCETLETEVSVIKVKNEPKEDMLVKETCDDGIVVSKDPIKKLGNVKEPTANSDEKLEALKATHSEEENGQNKTSVQSLETAKAVHSCKLDDVPKVDVTNPLYAPFDPGIIKVDVNEVKTKTEEIFDVEPNDEMKDHVKKMFSLMK